MSVRTLMAAVFAVGVLVGCLVGEVKGRLKAARARRDVVAEIRAARYLVCYDWQYDSDGPRRPPRRWPGWLVDRVGIDFLSQPILVDLSSPLGIGLRPPMGLVDSGLMARLGRLERLETLDLNRNPLVTDADLAHLAGMTRLRHLRLSYNAIRGEGLAHLEKLTNLETLSLSRMPKLTTIAPVARIRSLRRLSVQVPPNVDLLADLDGSRLKSLSVLGEDVGDSHVIQVARIASLQELSLSGSKLSDAGLLRLKSLKGLKKLELHGVLLTDAGVKAIQEHLPETKITWRR